MTNANTGGRGAGFSSSSQFPRERGKVTGLWTGNANLPGWCFPVNQSIYTAGTRRLDLHPLSRGREGRGERSAGMGGRVAFDFAFRFWLTALTAGRRGLAIGQRFGDRAGSLSRVLPEQGALIHPAPIYVILRCWQATVSGASCEDIRAMHGAGPAPSGDFWFLLVASKGTRRRQGILGKGDFELVCFFPRRH